MYLLRSVTLTLSIVFVSAKNNIFHDESGTEAEGALQK